MCGGGGGTMDVDMYVVMRVVCVCWGGGAVGKGFVCGRRGGGKSHDSGGGGGG